MGQRMGSLLQRIFTLEESEGTSVPFEVPVGATTSAATSMQKEEEIMPASASAEPVAPLTVDAIDRIDAIDAELPPAPEATESEITAEETPQFAADDSLNSALIPALVPAPVADEPAGEVEKGATADAAPRVDPGEWALEATLANHLEWLQTHGASGHKADLRSAKLEGTELISVKLRHADMEDADLRAADLLLGDLRDACLMRANLDEACLVGTNLEGANLEGASLEDAMGLVPRQLAGSNLRAASLPAGILEFPALAEFTRASRMAARYFSAVLSCCAIFWLIIWRTRDVQLLSDTAVLPFAHTTTALPTAEFYLIAPVLLFILYAVFHFHLQRTWETLLELPAVFPDGRMLGSDAPRMVMALARAHFRWLQGEASSARFIEKWTSCLLAYWIAPFTLLLFWARYLTRQEIHGTLLHESLVVAAAGIAWYSTTRVGRPEESWSSESGRENRLAEWIKKANMAVLAAGMAVALTILSAGVMLGVPHDLLRGPQCGAGNVRRWIPDVFWAVGFDPYANLTEATISSRPASAPNPADSLSGVHGANLNEINFRYAQAYGAFLAKAHLWRTNFEGAFMSEADLRSADLGQANLRSADLDRAQMDHANLDRGMLDGVNFAQTDLREANLSYSSLAGANLIDARLDGASLYGAQLNSAVLVRAILEKADLRDAHLESADLDHADLQQAYLWSAKLANARLEGAQLGSAIFIGADLNGADLRGAHFQGTVLNDVNLRGANLEDADLRGALGLTASQVCSAKSLQGALLDDALLTQVNAQCGPQPTGQNPVTVPTAATASPAAANPTTPATH